MSSLPVDASGQALRKRVESTLGISQLAGRIDPALRELEARALGEIAAAWREGVRTPAEKWFERHSELGAHSQLAVRIIYEEVCLREECGEEVASAEIYARFPQWQQALEVLLDCHGLMQSQHATASFPEAGQRIGEFQLLSELGRGAVGRVFLATQPALSDRPLVVKLTPRSGGEHLSLARLQHTHIAPLYLVQDFPAENLRALCMPYLGGDSWAHLLEDLRPRAPRERTGRQIVELLALARGDAPIHDGPVLRFLSRATYVQAVCWIGACIGDALHYAHQRGLVHLDIKPSNVLLAGDGQPMLLDFHLARDMIEPGGEPIDRLGGTRGYMSPEQERAAIAVREGQALSVGLDSRSDIYSLGALLYESLSGQLPPATDAASRRDLRLLNPLVSRGLEDVIHKCLARDPAARYRDAGSLAADLGRHLADLPLGGVPNRSLKERWQKWRRRRPDSLALSATLLVAATATAAAGLLFHGERLREARSALLQGQQHLDGRDYAAAVERFEAGRQAIRWLPGQYDLKQALELQVAAAKKVRLADTLHKLVERLRFVDSSEAVPRAKLGELEAGCAAVWQARGQIVRRDAAASTEVEQHLRSDLLDLAVLWADLRVRLASAEQAELAQREALNLLDEARELCGVSPALDLARRDYTASSTGQPVTESALPAAQTVWEHDAVGRWLFRAEQFGPAQKEFERAIEIEPNAFWPNFYRALCAYRLERFDEALNAASVCVALSPESAECFFNRALAHQALGHAKQALGDFSSSLELDPSLAAAAFHRGALLSDLGRYREASADLQLALARGALPAKVYYQMALNQLAQRDQAAALESLVQSLSHDATYAPALDLKSKLQSRP